MKLAFGILGLLLTLAIVGLLAKRQLGEVSKPLPALQTLPGAPADASPRQQTEQVRQAVQGLMQQPRPEAEPQAPSK